jgi:hypothetical protein
MPVLLKKYFHKQSHETTKNAEQLIASLRFNILTHINYQLSIANYPLSFAAWRSQELPVSLPREKKILHILFI